MNEEKFNEKWNIHNMIQEAIHTAHTSPSAETRERLAVLEVNQDNMMEKLNEYQETNLSSHNSILEAVKSLESKLDSALSQKANKWVEKALIGFVIFVLTGLASYVGKLIYMSIIHLE